jgi:hypothetical protein
VGGPGPNKPVDPANSIILNTNNNCNFYKWSEQMFLWLTSPASPPYQGGRVFDSNVFYQVNGSTLMAQSPFPRPPLTFALRAAQVGPDGLPVIMDAAGHVREVVSAPRTAGVAAVETGRNGRAEFRDANNQRVTVAPRVTADMLPQRLGRLTGLLQPSSNRAALSATAQSQQIADALTAKRVLIKFSTATGPVFVEAGTGVIVNPGPGQAGGNGVLLSQQKSVIFYETLVNDVYAWYLTGRKTQQGGIPPYYDGSPANYGFFPTTGGDLQAIESFAKAHGGTTPFPDGRALAVEIKLSWVDAKTLPNNAQGYITAEALVPTYDTSNSADWVPQPQLQPATVALVGAHFVGSAKGHPEMIWATFEHVRNTPLAQYQYNSGGKTVTVPQNTSGNWVFSNSTATSFNVQMATLCPDWSPPSQPTPECPTSLNGHIIAYAYPNPTKSILPPTDVLRLKPWGVADNGVPNNEDKTPAASNTEIISIDTDIQAKLAAAGASTDPRYNYLMIGSTWTFGGKQPSLLAPNGAYANNAANPPSPPPYNVVGTSMLFNSTMETFQQGGDGTSQTGFNCFSCHSDRTGDVTKPANTFVSHIFDGVSPLPLPQ